MTQPEDCQLDIRKWNRGWSFSPKDFSDLDTRSSIDVALHRVLAEMMAQISDLENAITAL